MTSTIQGIFGAAGLEPEGTVVWGQPVPQTAEGVYIISLSEQLNRCPLSVEALGELLDVRRELTLDGKRPDIAELGDRLAAFWLPDEAVLYIGLAGTSLQRRIGQYYRTPLGARSPHSGGWFLKTLSILPKLAVHYASCTDPRDCEDAMLASFSANVSRQTQGALYDPDRPIPFANREWPKGRVKQHGIRGARKPRCPLR